LYFRFATSVKSVEIWQHYLQAYNIKANQVEVFVLLLYSGRWINIALIFKLPGLINY